MIDRGENILGEGRRSKQGTGKEAKGNVKRGVKGK